MGSASNNPNENDVAKLLSMGFDRARVIQALEECGSLEDALNLLLTRNGGGGGGGGDGGRGSIIDADAKQTKDFLDRDIAWDSVDPPLKLADSDGNDKVSLPTSMMENILDAHATKSTDKPLQPLPAVGAHVEQIDDNIGPEPWQWNNDNDGHKKKSAVLAARMELANDIRGPVPPMFSMDRDFRHNNCKKSSALISGGKGAFVSNNIETANSFTSFDLLDGENYFRESIIIPTATEEEGMNHNNGTLVFPPQKIIIKGVLIPVQLRLLVLL